MSHKLAARYTATVAQLQNRREAGQGTLEYIGMIIVAALIVVAVITAVGDGATFGQRFSTAVNSVFN